MKREDKLITAGLIVLFFVIGLVVFMYGVNNGEQIAVQVSRPEGATSWTTSEIQTKMISYGICVFGALWILISHILLVLYIARNHIFKDKV